MDEENVIYTKEYFSAIKKYDITFRLMDGNRKSYPECDDLDPGR